MKNDVRIEETKKMFEKANLIILNRAETYYNMKVFDNSYECILKAKTDVGDKLAKKLENFIHLLGGDPTTTVKCS